MFKIQNDFKGANVSRTIRFTPELFEELNKIASNNMILFNLLVLQCCRYALNELEEDSTEDK